MPRSYILSCENEVATHGGEEEESFVVDDSKQCRVERGDVIGFLQPGLGSIYMDFPDPKFGIVCQAPLVGAYPVGHKLDIQCGGPHLEQRGYAVRVTFCPDSWGWPFILAVAIVTALYLSAGVAYGRHKSYSRNSRLGPLAAHPHAGKFLWLAGLCVDGVRYVRHGSRGGGATLERSLLLRDNVAGTSGAARKQKRGGKKERSRTKSSPSDKPMVAETGESADPFATEELAEAVPPPQWRPTVSPHISIGARETGVKIVS